MPDLELGKSAFKSTLTGADSQIFTLSMQDFPGGSDGKASAYNVGDLGSIPGSGRSPGEGNGNPVLLGKSHGWKSLVGFSPWGRKESETTE